MGLKGFVFTMDAIVAITIAIAMLATVAYMGFESIYPEKGYEELTYIAEDIMNALTYLKVKEVKDKPTIQRLIEKKILSDADLEKSVLDLIGSFWYAGNASIAENISREVLEGIVDDICLNLTLENQTIYSSCDTQPKELVVSSRMETGYEAGRPVYGYIARAFLVSIRGKKDSSYIYFGGYEGDGNITKILTLPSFDTILEAYMELDVGSNFTLWINGNYSGFYVNGSAGGGFMRADKWVICNLTYRPENCSSFKEGENIITLNFTGNESYVGGGFIRVTYNTTELAPIVNVNSTRYRFPGIQGLINLYSSFYVPGNLTSMSVHLHYKNNYTTFLTIGNVTVWEDDTPTEMVVDIPNSTLASLLDYSELSEKTIPIRLGTKAFRIEMVPAADVVLITDVSGSMNWRMDSQATGVDRECCNGNPCSSIEELVRWMENDTNIIYDPSTSRISLAKCLDKYFIYNIFNASDEHRMALISFSDGIESSTPLTNNTSYLYSVVDNYPDDPSGGTCICCGINEAYNILASESEVNRKKFVVVMSDGIPSHKCTNTGCEGNETTAYFENDCAGWGCCCPADPATGSGCDTSSGYCRWFGCSYCRCLCEIENANYSSCRIHNDLNSTVYSIGFGPVANCPMGNWTLQLIANCGNGSFYPGANGTQLKEVYKNISEEIIQLGYAAQRIEIKKGLVLNNTLYQDSYIELNYTPILNPIDYGEISISRETDRFGGNVEIPFKEGWLNVTPEITIVDMKVTSYSSEYWTDRVYVNSSVTGDWKAVYWLGDYGDDYQPLGDPYIVQIPVSYIGIGNNSIRVGTGGSPSVPTGGSPDSRLIYTMRLRSSVGYGDVFNSSQLAIEDAINRLNSTVGKYVDIGREENIITENRTIGGIQWLWGPSLFKILVWKG